MKTLKITLALVLFLLLAPAITQAQDNTVFTITTWKIHIPEDGTREELNTLMAEFQKKITQPNEKIISERAMRHLSGDDSRDLVFITEYANWNDIEAASIRQEELIDSAWESDEARDAFFKKFNKYFIMHTDEIYSGINNFDKN
ncbi:hypothetical protein AB9K26_06840 [Psychroserpens sp. XS_ASV72]|uniref:hypothetical protein n=1 Tax=Psychroserpens sp. XS_ASV72 TaxID=3241293 RepID=UPI003517E622